MRTATREDRASYVIHNATIIVKSLAAFSIISADIPDLLLET